MAFYEACIGLTYSSLHSALSVLTSLTLPSFHYCCLFGAFKLLYQATNHHILINYGQASLIPCVGMNSQLREFNIDVELTLR